MRVDQRDGTRRPAARPKPASEINGATDAGHREGPRMQSNLQTTPDKSTASGREATNPRFFDPHQRATIAAAMARIIPTDDVPGAAEAGAIEFLDRYLSGTDYIYAKPDGSGFEALSGRSEQAWRTRIGTIRRKYVDGVRELDSRSRHAFGADFAALSPDQQDSILKAVEAREAWPDSALSPAYALGGPAASGPALQQTSTEVELDFLPLLVVHTRQGFLADPIYGGNRDRIGWKVLGFPGPTSLAEVHGGHYSTIGWFADGHTDPVPENRSAHHGA
jgi:gluconate 2-dehydrogenase gamma chain